jgi:hypothetical protein
MKDPAPPCTAFGCPRCYTIVFVPHEWQGKRVQGTGSVCPKRRDGCDGLLERAVQEIEQACREAMARKGVSIGPWLTVYFSPEVIERAHAFARGEAEDPQ